MSDSPREGAEDQHGQGDHHDDGGKPHVALQIPRDQDADHPHYQRGNQDRQEFTEFVVRHMPGTPRFKAARSMFKAGTAGCGNLEP
jgi:hypothetical protein